MKLITVTDTWTEKSSRALRIGKHTIKLWIVATIMIAMVGTAAAAVYMYVTVPREVITDATPDYGMILSDAGPYTVYTPGGKTFVPVELTNSTASAVDLAIGSNIWEVTAYVPVDPSNDPYQLNVYLCGSDYGGLPAMEATVPATGSWSGFLCIEDVGESTPAQNWGDIDFYLQDPALP